MEKIGVVALLLLHAPDGHVVRIAPSQITTLHAPKVGAKKEDKLFSEGVNCLINTTDGKHISVVEPCTVVQQMLENAR